MVEVTREEFQVWTVLPPLGGDETAGAYSLYDEAQRRFEALYPQQTADPE